MFKTVCKPVSKPALFCGLLALLFVAQPLLQPLSWSATPGKQATKPVASHTATTPVLPTLQEPDPQTAQESAKTALFPTAPERNPLLGSVYQAQYVIGAGDAIYAEDSNMGELVKDGRILSDGSINLPLVGKVFLAGLSIPQAKQRLAEKFGKFFVDPQITLQVTNQRPVRVYVMGAVAHPGVYVSGKNMAPDSLERVSLGSFDSLYWFYRMYLGDALILSGGLNYNANATDIKIHRTFPTPVTIHVNLMDLFNNGNIVQDIPLRDQDVIEIAELPDSALVMDDQWEQFSSNNFNQATFKISVLGAVEHPGPFEVKMHDNVLNAVAKAGGFTDLADKDRVYVLRSTTNGQVVKRELNLKDKALIGSKPFETWAALLPNDVVYVDESKTRKAQTYGMSLVDKASGAALFPIFNNYFQNRSKSSKTTSTKK